MQSAPLPELSRVAGACLALVGQDSRDSHMAAASGARFVDLVGRGIRTAIGSGVRAAVMMYEMTVWCRGRKRLGDFGAGGD